MASEEHPCMGEPETAAVDEVEAEHRGLPGRLVAALLVAYFAGGWYVGRRIGHRPTPVPANVASKWEVEHLRRELLSVETTLLEHLAYHRGAEHAERRVDVPTSS